MLNKQLVLEVVVVVQTSTPLKLVQLFLLLMLGGIHHFRLILLGTQCDVYTKRVSAGRRRRRRRLLC